MRDFEWKSPNKHNNMNNTAFVRRNCILNRILKMAAPRVRRCDLCARNICSIIISSKLLFDYVFRNNYSESWERTLPQPRRVEQRRRRNNIRLFQVITVIPVLISLLITANFYGGTSINMVISCLSSTVYLLTFWYVTYAREEFRVIHRAWHSSGSRELYSKICIPEHVKLNILVVALAEIVAPMLLSGDVAWFLVTVLQFSSFYSFQSLNLYRIFSRFRPGDNELRYMIE